LSSSHWPCWKKLAAEFPHEPDYRVELGHTLWLLGRGVQRQRNSIFYRPSRRGRTDRAQGANDGLRPSRPSNPKVRFYRQETAFSHRTLCTIFVKTGRPQLAVASYRQAIVLYADLVAEVPNSFFYRRELGYSLGGLSNELQANQQILEADQAYRQAVGNLPQAGARVQPWKATAGALGIWP